MVRCVCVGNKHNHFINEDYKVKENKIMGVTVKPVGKFKSIMRKLNNQLLAEKQVAKTKKKEKK